MTSQAEGEVYRLEIERWRSAREASLRAPDGWLSLAGLFMLEEGEFRVGSGNGNRIVLPPSAPEELGTLFFAQGKGTLHLTTDAPVLVNGSPLAKSGPNGLADVELVDNSNGQAPTMVSVGSVSMNLHKFGNEVALRVRDCANPAIREFAGCRWYEIQPSYRVHGRLTRHDAPTSIPVNTSVQTEAAYQSVGVIEFELQGRPLTLVAAAASKATELFIILRDTTAGRETYGAGRYLYAEVDGAGNVTLDFNRAYNPPCALTHYATCSLPPKENLLPVAIEAGEQYLNR